MDARHAAPQMPGPEWTGRKTPVKANRRADMQGNGDLRHPQNYPFRGRYTPPRRRDVSKV